MKMSKFLCIAVASLPMSLPIASANAATAVILVGGGSNPFLAGAPAGTMSGNDIAPAQSPVLFPAFVPGSTFTFSVTGTTDGAGTGTTGPDGAYLFNMFDYSTGIAPAAQVGVLGLIGVFLDATTPSGATQPGGLDFSSGLNFAALTPGLNQIFWIGDGLTGTGTGSSQVFTAPTGATRLFLGTVDGFDWNNNSGAYTVTANYTSLGGSGVPEPAVWAMMIAGFGMIGLMARRRPSVRQTVVYA